MRATATAEAIYETSVKDLPIVERLRLVKLVMDDLMSGPDSWIVDENNAWSDQDYADLGRASLKHAAESPEEYEP